jgi:multidrug efflux pump subunit AcrA (membrane-fusion protein)
MGNRFRRLAVAGIIVVVVAAGAGTAYAAMSSPGPSYRLAAAVPAEVTATLQEVGTLTPVHQAGAGFAVSGTVQAVKVQSGQHVIAGQTLGTLDTTSLQAALTAAQSTLANANLQVHNDLASQDAAAGGSGSSPGASGASPGTSPAARLVSSLRPLQQAVLNAQRKADSLFTQARTALAQARRTCSPPSPPGPTPTPTPTTLTPTPTTPTPTTPTPTTPTPTPTPTSSPSPSPTASASWPGPAASPSPSPASTPAATAAAPEGAGTALAPRTAPLTCLGATQRVLAAEAAVLQAQQALSGRLAALTDALAKAITAAGQSSSGGGGTVGGGASGGTAGSGGGSSSSGGSGGGAVSAAQLAADQASADAAAAQVTVAQQNLAAATLVSPISGTVVMVSATPGAAETAGSVAFEVAGLDSYQVVTQVPVTDMPQLKVGEPASVLPDGANVPLSGSVVSIGLIPDSTGSPTTYPVTIGLAGQPAGLHPGGYAAVTITTARSSGVSVPTSAVHRSGHKATVTVYAGGKTRVTKVTVGTIGPVMTRITAGLRAGQQVVLANLSQPLPNTNPTGGGPGFGRVVPFGGGSVNFVAPG